jgi:hypothetical protein
MMEKCPVCGRDIGEKNFCPFCGTARTVQPPAQLPPTVLPPPPGVAQAVAPEKKKRTLLWVVLAVIAVAVVAGVVVAVVLLSGDGVSVTITSPTNGSTVTGPTVVVTAVLSSTSGVSRVDIYLDDEKRSTVYHAPYKAKLTGVSPGAHNLEFTAFDGSGFRLASARSTFEVKGGADKPKDGQDDDSGKSSAYKTAVASRIDEASALNSRISSLADRINSDVNFASGSVPSSLTADAQNLYAQALTLIAGASALDPPTDMADIQSQFKILVEYLKVRAEALQKGLRAITAGGDYKAEFDRGGAAKSSFDAAWPGFLNTCRGRGISI